MFIGAVDDEFEVLDQLVQAARGIAQVDNNLGLAGGDGLHQRVDALVSLFQCIDGSVGRR